jgi:hypothetical protein
MDLTNQVAAFHANLESVRKLVNFDAEVRDIALKGVQSLHEFLKESKGFENPAWNGERTLQILRSIRDSPALKDRYSTIYNSAVVLLVSYFGSAIGDVFRAAAARAVTRNDPRVLDTELKIKVGDVVGLTAAPEEQIGEMLIQKEGISFQDMQSTHRAFKHYFGVELPTTEAVKNIIVGQACRHAIVHDGATANARVMNQVRNATPRTLKQDLCLNQKIKFSIAEVDLLAADMKSYIENLANVVGEN